VLAGEDEFATAWLLNLEAAIEREPGCFGRPGSVKAKELFPHEAAHEFLARNQTRSTRPTAAGRAIMSKRIVTAVIVLLVASIGGYAAFLAKKPPENPHGPVWTEAAWPFPVDQWGGGWAFQCKAADCGIDVNLYLRPKIGFCNCQTGVADDEELERVSDVDLVGDESSALGPGRPIAVHWMKGRSRGYQIATPAAGAPSAKSVLSLAFNSRCDVIVATVIAGKEPLAQEQAVLEFLNGDLVLNWAKVVLGI
jgi:hypothetical protein